MYRPEGALKYCEPDIHTLAAIVATNKISGRSQLARFATLEVQQGEKVSSAAAVYAYANYLYK
jgi:hypothetical protein